VREASRDATTNTLKAIAESYFAIEREKPAEDRLRSLDRKHQKIQAQRLPAPRRKADRRDQEIQH